MNIFFLLFLEYYNWKRRIPNGLFHPTELGINHDGLVNYIYTQTTLDVEHVYFAVVVVGPLPTRTCILDEHTQISFFLNPVMYDKFGKFGMPDSDFYRFMSDRSAVMNRYTASNRRFVYFLLNYKISKNDIRSNFENPINDMSRLPFP